MWPSASHLSEKRTSQLFLWALQCWLGGYQHDVVALGRHQQNWRGTKGLLGTVDLPSPSLPSPQSPKPLCLLRSQVQALEPGLGLCSIQTHGAVGHAPNQGWCRPLSAGLKGQTHQGCLLEASAAPLLPPGVEAPCLP